MLPSDRNKRDTTTVLYFNHYTITGAKHRYYHDKIPAPKNYQKPWENILVPWLLVMQVKQERLLR